MLNLKAFIKGLLVQNDTDRTKELAIEVDSSATTGTRTTVQSSQTANRTIDLPDADDTLVGRATTDTLSNKTLDNSNSATFVDNSLTIQGDGDATKQVQFNADSVSTATTRTLSLPDADDTLVGEAASQTLTNKVIEGNSSGTNTVTTTAANVEYDPASSGLTAVDAQAAIDEVEGRVEAVETDKVDGPGTHADNALPRFNGVDTNDLQASGVLVDDVNSITGVNGITTTGDVTVGGNLQVNGTTTSVNSATLEVTDANVVVNNNGNQASANAQGAGITVEMSDATDASLAYDSTLASRFKIGDVGAEAEVADVSSAQTLTNKTINGASNTISNLLHGTQVDNPTSGVHGVTGDVVGTSDAQVLTNKDIDGSTASNTSRLTVPQDTKTNLDALTRKAGTVVYANDLETYFGDNGTNLIEFGSGSGEKNYFKDGNFENNIALATTYDDGGAYVDGTGGTPTVISVAQNGTDALEGDLDLAITKAASDATGEGVTLLSETIDRADFGKPLFVSIEVDATDANYSSGDLRLQAYDVTNGSIINILPLVNLDDNSGILQGQSRIQAVVYTNSDTAQVRVSLHMQTDSATGSSWTVNIDAAKLKSDSPQPGTFISSPEQIMRVAGAPSGSIPSLANNVSSTVIWSAPSVLEDTGNNYDPSTGRYNVTEDGIYTVHAGLGLTGTFPNNGVTQIEILVNGAQVVRRNIVNNSSNGANASSVISATFSASAGDNIRINVRPANWSLVTFVDTIRNYFIVHKAPKFTTNQQSTIETTLKSAKLIASRSTSTQNVSTGVVTNILYNNIISEDGGSNFNTGTGIFTAPKTGYYFVTANVYTSLISVVSTLELNINQNGSNRGRFRLTTTGVNNNYSLNTSSLIFAQKGDTINATFFQNTGASVSLIQGNGITNFSVAALPDLTLFGVNGTFEVISSSSAAATYASAPSGRFLAMTGNSVTLTPGTWRLTGNILPRQGTSTGTTFFIGDFNNQNGDNSSTNLPGPDGETIGGANSFFLELVSGNLSEGNIPVPQRILRVTEETEVFLNFRCSHSSPGTGQVSVNITAERLQ